MDASVTLHYQHLCLLLLSGNILPPRNFNTAYRMVLVCIPTFFVNLDYSQKIKSPLKFQPDRLEAPHAATASPYLRQVMLKLQLGEVQ